MTTATIKRSLGANDVAPALRQPRRYSSFSIFLVTLAFLLASASVPPFIKPWIRSRELNVPHQGIETQMRLAPGSYRVDARTRFENLSPPLPIVAGSTGNVVAVLLNWSRFENVRRIVSLLCGSELDLIMKRVLVWNNNPKPLKYLDFYRPLVQRKSCRSSIRRRTRTSTRDIWGVHSRMQSTVSFK
ncbi:hypothetical protein B0F90DRAFT_153385 [Multifurca ochricompacta]|uniref:Uncharacterized protein n=1 Tax=Multifurca ochricompacta TaxID=376703 RepID=A0AAD4MDA2_9AGAM|nr:hypothetical protein B0F90DRAFT_153385 [Multifurca ochricompacta]